jgi:PiT family inorganic phosphate transporter
MGSTFLLVVVVVTAVSFDFTNGFHDTANAVATSIATGALKPMVAVIMSGCLNFLGAFISISVAATIAKGVVSPDVASSAGGLEIVLAALLGAIIWNLTTWCLSIPSSSSHAIIGGLVGASVAAVGSGAVSFHGIIEKVVAPAVLAVFICGGVAALGTFAAYAMVRRLGDRQARTGYRYGQIGSAALVSLAHGTNDAQKTMGIIALALVAHGDLSAANPDPPTWVVISAASAIALGTYVGGWRIIRTLGSRIIKMDPAQGFVAQGAGASVILAASHFGYPLSTTHVASGAVMGAGAGKRLSAVRWGVAGNIVAAWVLTVPGAGLVGAATYGVTSIFGTGALGPLLVSVSLLALLVAAFGRRIAQGRSLTAEG